MSAWRDSVRTIPIRAYSLSGFGHKFRANPLAIALADAAMDTLDERNEIRDRQARVLGGIADLDFLIPQAVPADSRRVYAYHYMLYDPAKFGGVNPSTLLLALAEEGVKCGGCGFGRLHQAPAIIEGGGFGNLNPHDTPVSLPVSEDMGRRQIMVALRFEQECPELIEQYIAAYHRSPPIWRSFRSTNGRTEFAVSISAAVAFRSFPPAIERRERKINNKKKGKLQ